jgi:hypothetical protein
MLRIAMRDGTFFINTTNDATNSVAKMEHRSWRHRHGGGIMIHPVQRRQKGAIHGL